MTEQAAQNFKAQVAVLLAPLKARLEALPTCSRFTDSEAEAIYALGQQLASQGRTREAFEHFAFLVAFRPSSTRYLMALASIHCENKRFRDALVVYRTLDAIDPFNPTYALAMAECFMHLRDEQAAQALLQEVIGHCEREGTHLQILSRARALRDIFERSKGNDGSS